MDDDVFLANNSPISNGINARTQAQHHGHDILHTDTVGIFVEAEWGSATQTGIQLCPAVFIPSAAQIPRAIKHIYRHDDGIGRMFIVGWEIPQFSAVWRLPPQSWTKAFLNCSFPWLAPEIHSVLRSIVLAVAHQIYDFLLCRTQTELCAALAI